MTVLTYCQHEQHTMLRYVVLCGGGGGEAAVCGSQWGSSPAGDQRSTAVAEAASVIIASIRTKTAPLLPPPPAVSWQGDPTYSPSIPTHPCVCLERPITNFQAPRGVPSLPHYSPNMREKRVWPQLREIQTWSKSTGHWLLFWSRPRPLRWSVLAAGDSSGAVLHSSTATHRLIISRIMTIVCQMFKLFRHKNRSFRKNPQLKWI